MMKRYFPFFAPQPKSVVKYDSLSLIDKIKSPVLFIHGQFDQTIPVSMARRLFENAPDPKEFYEIPGADHNDTYLVGGHEYFVRWQTFLNKCLRE